MGWNTTVLVLNDALHEIENDPSFGKRLGFAIQQNHMRPGRIDVPVGCHANPVTVLEQHHADQVAMLAVGGNDGRVLGHGFWQDSNEQLLKRVADELGYRLVKKPKR